MKLTKLEHAILMITVLTLTAMLSYFLGARSAAQPVTITTSNARPSSTAAEVSSPAAEESNLPQSTEPLTDEGAQSAPKPSFPINLNTASVDELMLLPSIGEVRARAIVEYRERNGPFCYVEDLRNVKGIGEEILAQIMNYVTVSEGETNG